MDLMVCLDNISKRNGNVTVHLDCMLHDDIVARGADSFLAFGETGRDPFARVLA